MKGHYSYSSPQKYSSSSSSFSSMLLYKNETFLDYIQSLAESGRHIRAADKKLQPVDEQVSEKFNKYIQKVGIDLLKMKPSDVNTTTITTAAKTASVIQNVVKSKHVQHKVEVFQKLGRLIKVDDLEEDSLSTIIDNEWNTRFWSVEMIESACNALVLVFSNPDLESSSIKKEKALVMLLTLMNRHRIAEHYIKRNVEVMIGKINSNTIRDGRCTGLLDLLYIIHGLRERFVTDLSQYNFCGLAFELILLEVKLACVIIQNNFRIKSELSRKSTSSYPIIEGFGDPNELKQLRESVSNGLTNILREKWKNTRASLDRKSKSIYGGLRSSVSHIPEKYMVLFLEIILTLVSHSSEKDQYLNRDIIVQSHGCVLLSTYVAYPMNPLSNVSMEICMNVSHIVESFYPLLQVDIVKSCLKYFQYHLTIIKNIMEKNHKKSQFKRSKSSTLTSNRSKYSDSSNSGGDNKNNNNHHNHTGTATGTGTDTGTIIVKDLDEEQLRYRLKLVIDLIANLSIHEAGIQRTKTIIKENNIYSQIQTNQHSTVLSLHLYNAHGFEELLLLIVEFGMITYHIPTMRAILKCFLSMTSSDCQETMIMVMISHCSRLLERFVELMEEEDQEISTSVLCLLLQCCSKYHNRDRLLMFTPLFLKPFLLSTNNYTRKPYRKAIFIACALLRHREIDYYDPKEIIQTYMNNQTVHESIYLDIIQSMKHIEKKDPSNDNDNNSHHHLSQLLNTYTLEKMVLLPNNTEICYKISKLAREVGAKGLCDYFSHPSDELYHHNYILDRNYVVVVL